MTGNSWRLPSITVLPRDCSTGLGVRLIEGNLYWHSDRETAEVVPPTGLAASTRAYAKVITDVNQLSLKDLLRPQATEARR